MLSNTYKGGYLDGDQELGCVHNQLSLSSQLFLIHMTYSRAKHIWVETDIELAILE
jgi:hypothetical protein